MRGRTINAKDHSIHFIGCLCSPCHGIRETCSLIVAHFHHLWDSRFFSWQFLSSREVLFIFFSDSIQATILMLDLWHAKDKIWEIFLVHALKISLGDLNGWSSPYLVADFDLLYFFSQFASTSVAESSPSRFKSGHRYIRRKKLLRYFGVSSQMTGRFVDQVVGPTWARNQISVSEQLWQPDPWGFKNKFFRIFCIDLFDLFLGHLSNSVVQGIYLHQSSNFQDLYLIQFKLWSQVVLTDP